MFTIHEILEATGGTLIRGSLKNRVSGVSIDSRTIKPGEIFIAIRGRRLNGHSFITQAETRGASAIIFSEPRYKARTSAYKYSSRLALVRVKDTTSALGTLAHYYRARFKIPVIAITGSNGKTTTKEMLSTILASRFNVLYNPGTENNYIGVPLSIFSLREKHDLAVIEIGANHAGEINWLSWIIQPSVGIITNIGASHLEFFRSPQGVFKAKLELLKNLAKNGKLIINRDDRFLSQLNGANFRTSTFGMSQSADFWARLLEQTEIETTFLLNKRHQIVLKTLGRHNIYNALAAVAGARNFGLSFKAIRQALVAFKAPAMRMQMLKINDIKIINDCYNANPDSFGCALDFLRDHQTLGRKIVVCGDMLELGQKAERLHLNLGKRLAKSEIDFLLTVGHLAKKIASGACLAGMSNETMRTCGDSEVAAKSLREIVHPKDIVLIKGSRAMQMENVLKCFTTSSTH